MKEKQIKRKKSTKFYKKWYFWVISILLITNMFLLISVFAYFDKVTELENKLTISTSNTLKNADSDIQTDQSSVEPVKDSIDHKSFKENEEAFVYDSNGEKLYSLKIISATTKLTEDNEHYTDGKPDNTIQLTYEYKNYNYNKPLLVTSQFINAYNTDGQAGKNMSMMDGQTNVSEGKSSQTTIWFVMPNVMANESEVTIEYTNDFSHNFEDTISFKVPLTH